MRAQASRDESTREHVVQVRVSDVEVAMDVSHMRDMLRREIVSRLADQIMPKIKMTIEGEPSP